MNMCGQEEEGEGQEKHNRKELKRMIYLYQQTEKGEQMICDSREKRGENNTKQRRERQQKWCEKSILVVDNCNRMQVDHS